MMYVCMYVQSYSNTFTAKHDRFENLPPVTTMRRAVLLNCQNFLFLGGVFTIKKIETK